MSTAERYDDYRGYRQDRGCGPSVRFHPGWIVLMILGFIFWWPIGLAILAFTIWSRNMGCYGSDRWQRKMDRMEEKVGRLRERMQGFGAGGLGAGPWGAPRSSGNHAFDEYRTETLRRLEEEQREFRDFLDRLRFAKDKSSSTSSAERRNRPQPVPPAPQPQS